ncbi:GspE/PulE family protein [Calycomorphotria hydatis]|uniref:Type II/IV secretion system protein n=1 Tax=Calycomorphotria hydatis TaxID=2528027 RepID=A0A517T5W9_9PLAN|nr:GspE/PulE family protein [Calycomorphotria hydatis]QDT63764.1 Type II/IV secretion system protein [Calycomorphotria hydatis]
MAADWIQDFLNEGLISKDQLEEAQQVAAAKHISVGDALVQLDYVDASRVSAAQASEFGSDMVDLAEMEIPPSVIELVAESMARENTIIPIKATSDRITIAFHDPSRLDVEEKLRFILAKDIEIVVAPKDQIQAAIDRCYGQNQTESVDSMLAEFTETQIDFTATEVAQATAEMEEDEDENAPVVKLVNLIISEAVKMRASDIHIEPFEDRIRIRYRIDGKLVERDQAPRRLLPALTSRIKIMAKIDIAEKRRPQDGRIKTRTNGKDLDLRLNVLPTNHGQALCLRILDRDNIKIGIRNLGFSEENYRIFQNIIRRPNGIFLVTGPTGSGKTTTLYSALGELNRPDKKIITAEDPVEYYLPGINQCEVKANIGLNFSKIIKAMLRQAPNVILVGEIRDVETADMAIQASLTGHLVFSTLHTNDAPGSVTRLIDMGVQPFLVASSVMAVMAQRLIRRVCGKCAQEYVPDQSEIDTMQLTPDELSTGKFVRGRGCKECQHTGYRGRVAVFELMVMNSGLREMAFRSEPTQNIRRQARLYGMKTLVDDARDKALAGHSTMAEVLRLSKSDD